MEKKLKKMKKKMKKLPVVEISSHDDDFELYEHEDFYHRQEEWVKKVEKKIQLEQVNNSVFS